MRGARRDLDDFPVVGFNPAGVSSPLSCSGGNFKRFHAFPQRNNRAMGSYFGIVELRCHFRLRPFNRADQCKHGANLFFEVLSFRPAFAGLSLSCRICINSVAGAAHFRPAICICSGGFFPRAGL
jgi:hypothetical protein